MSRKPRSLTTVIFLKELRETLRDKRVVLGVIVSPLVLTPLLIAAIAFFAGKKAVQLQTETLPVGLYEEAAFPELTDLFEAAEALEIRRFATRAEAEAEISGRSIRAAIVVPAAAREAYSTNGSARVEILYNRANENSENAKNRLRGLLREFDTAALGRRLAQSGLPESFAKPTQVVETSLAEREDMGGFLLSMILPYLVVMGAAFGGINTAFDLCAGEKERGTLETLLVTPASRNQIVQGKLLTVFVVSLASALCSVLGILFVMLSGLALFRSVLGDYLDFSAARLAALFVIVAPLSLLTSSGLLLVSSFARNQKEAQAYIFPFIAIVVFPAGLSSILGAESPLYTAFIPILNVALAMKQILGNVFDLNYFCISLAASLAYAIIGMRAAAALFQRESILFRA